MGHLQPAPPRSPPPFVDAYHPYFKPLFSSHCEQDVLGKSNPLGVLGLSLGDVNLPYTLHSGHAPFQ